MRLRKTILTVFAALTAVLLANLNAQTLVEVSPDSVPARSFFYSLQNNFPPSPLNPFPDLPLYSDGVSSNYYYDTTGFDIFANLDGGGRSREDAPGFPGGGTNGGSGFTNTFSYSFDTNGLWLELTNIVASNACLNLHQATNQVYAIWSATDLSGPWGVEMEVWPTTSVMPFVVPTLNRSNLFMQAEDWTGVTENGNTVPDWWLWYYFGTTALSDTNLDSQGNSLLSDYQSGADPNVISFYAQITNQYVRSVNLPVQLTVTAGLPYAVAISVDDTNFVNDASWQAYTGPNLTVYLGSVEGWHRVWIGLRGFATGGRVTWFSVSANLKFTQPTLLITSPTNGTTVQPVLELQGLCDRPLSKITCDVSNSFGCGQSFDGFVTSQLYNSNSQHFETNTFQCFDVALAPGTNLISLRVSDQAGNLACTNIPIILDFSGDTNPPAMTLFWPQNGNSVSGTEFTLRGSLDDFTASVTAQIVDSSGNTNNVSALIERNGLFWAENLSLGLGTNTIALTATDAAGNVSTTNIVVNNLDSALTVDDFVGGLGGDSQKVLSAVTGTIALTNYTVWVNGVQATQNGDGTWEADAVPVGPGGTAVVEARAIPNSPADNSGTGTGFVASTDGTPRNPTAIDSVASQLERDQPPIYYLRNYNDQRTAATTDYYNCVPTCPATIKDVQRVQMKWNFEEGGTSTYYYESDWDSCDGDFSSWYSYDVTYPMDGWPPSASGVGLYTNSDGGEATISAPAPDLSMVEWSEVDHPIWLFASNECPASATGDYERQTATTMALKTGGKGIVGGLDLFEIDTSATAYLTYTYDASFNQTWTTAAASPGQITIQGVNPNASGQAFLALPDAVTIDATPQTPSQTHAYEITIGKEPTPLVGLTVISNATHVGTNNDWVAVMNPDGYVVLGATMTTNTFDHLKWSGGQFPAEGNAVRGPPTQRWQSTASTGKFPITASFGSTKFTVNVWVIWANIDYQFTNVTPTNAASLWTNAPNLFDNCPGYDLGVQLYTNQDLGNQGVWAWAKECTIATILPRGIHEIDTGDAWTISQNLMAHEFIDRTTNTYYTDTWADDSPHSYRFTHGLDKDDKIYGIDGPNIGEHYNFCTNSYEVHQNFQTFLRWHGTICSATNNYWHFTAAMVETNSPKISPSDLGSGLTPLPTSAQY